MSQALDELAELSADLKAWLEWEQCLGAVSWPRERVPRASASASSPEQARPPSSPAPGLTQPPPAAIAAPEPSAARPAPPRVSKQAAQTARSQWAAYAGPAPLASGTGPSGAALALVWTEGASGEAEEMLDRMLQGVLKLARQDIAVVTLARVRDDPANFRAALLAELDRLKPGLLLVMGTLGTRAILGGTSEPAESRAEWHVLEGAAQMWAVKITHHPEHIRLRAAAGDPIPRREAFEDLQAVAARL